VRFALPQYNLLLIDFQDIHKSFDKELLDDIHENMLMDTFKEKGFQNKDIKKLFFHHSIKSTVDYINKVNSNNKVILYFNNTQFYESEILNYIQEKQYLDILTKLLLKLRSVLPIKVVISMRSLPYFKELVKSNDGRARGTVLKINSTLSKFKIENFTFEKVKKFATKYELNFLSNEYFDNIRTKQLIFK
tara:strand:+ start:42949 stop:43518 length:570 start_codon:yes stop_codon:yes gene_type:complete